MAEQSARDVNQKKEPGSPTQLCGDASPLAPKGDAPSLLSHPEPMVTNDTNHSPGEGVGTQ
ncbi:hypothetical protein SynNOUM97013_01551 [Synechococcus sp. NOUM97013]|nr:hypothetical protein SynNOUM97013_01551 [Synechococcus sp. NOUM97013]